MSLYLHGQSSAKGMLSPPPLTGLSPAHLRANTKLFRQNGKAMPKGNPGKQQAEPEERIYKYIEEINADPVVYHWTYKMDETFI